MIVMKIAMTLLRRQQIDIDFVRRIMDHMTWLNILGVQLYLGLELNRYEGFLVYLGNKHAFTRFPKWVSVSHFILDAR